MIDVDINLLIHSRMTPGMVKVLENPEYISKSMEVSCQPISIQLHYNI